MNTKGCQNTKRTQELQTLSGHEYEALAAVLSYFTKSSVPHLLITDLFMYYHEGEDRWCINDLEQELIFSSTNIYDTAAMFVRLETATNILQFFSDNIPIYVG